MTIIYMNEHLCLIEPRNKNQPHLARKSEVALETAETRRPRTVRPAMTFVSCWFLGIIYWPVPPAGEYPRFQASNSDMNSPSLVFS